MSQYAELDLAILKAIPDGKREYVLLCGAMFRSGLAKDDRLVDRRLQSLRRRGLIYFRNRHWFLVSENSGRNSGGSKEEADK